APPSVRTMSALLRPDSILMTSAPYAPSHLVESGPAITQVKSSTRTPLSGRNLLPIRCLGSTVGEQSPVMRKKLTAHKMCLGSTVGEQSPVMRKKLTAHKMPRVHGTRASPCHSERSEESRRGEEPSAGLPRPFEILRLRLRMTGAVLRMTGAVLRMTG